MPKPLPPRTPGGPRFSISSCNCPDCRAACLNSPGWFMPREIDKLAKHLDLDVPTLFRKYLAVGVTHMPDGALRHGVMPHKLRDGKKPGTLWTLNELAQPGRCIFFDRGRCTIYEARPYECARMIHDRQKESVKLRHHIVAAWTQAALRPFAELTGKKLSGGVPGGRNRRIRPA
ncbi:MAG: YkgJ family cysteine cluster protein [Candidatus Krumholzibacteriia bacterium]